MHYFKRKKKKRKKERIDLLFRFADTFLKKDVKTYQTSQWYKLPHFFFFFFVLSPNSLCNNIDTVRGQY